MVENLDLSTFRVDYSPDSNPWEELEINGKSWYDIFSLWFAEAVSIGQIEPNAMVLGTLDEHDNVDTRTVLAKKIDSTGIVFYTNYHSAKGRALQYHPQASATFLWLALHRQIRVSGYVSQCGAIENISYWQQRPRSSQIGAWASAQSQVIGSRQELMVAYEKYEKKFASYTEIPLPDYWGGYRIAPYKVEFWVGRTGRFHDRYEFVRSDKPGSDTWIIHRLQP